MRDGIEPYSKGTTCARTLVYLDSDCRRAKGDKRVQEGQWN